jgi:tetratricopeptide (TPR) repeat protein
MPRRWIRSVLVVLLLTGSPVLPENAKADLGGSPAERLDLLITDGRAAIRAGDFRGAVSLFEQAWPLLRSDPDATVEERAQFARELARALKRVGRHRDAANTFREELRLLETLHGADSSDLTIVLLDIVESGRRADGRIGEHAELVERALRLQVERDASTLRGLRLRARDFVERDELGSASATLRQAIELQRELHPDGWRLRFDFLNQIGAFGLRAGRLQEAEQAFLEAIELEESFNGPMHKRLTRPLNGLGRVLASQGRTEEAALALERAVEVAAAVWGDNHAETVRLRASALETLGDVGAGRELRATLRGRAPTAVTPKVATEIRHLLADSTALQRQGEFDAAERSLIRVLELRHTHVGPDSVEVTDDLWRLGELYKAQQRNEKAVEYFVESLTLRERLVPSDDRLLEYRMGRLATHYSQTGALVRSEELFQKQFELQRSARAGDPALADTLASLASVASRREQHGRRVDYLRQRGELLEGLYGLEARETRDARTDLALALSAAGYPDEAEPLLAELLVMEERLEPGLPLRQVRLLRALSRAYATGGRIGEATAVLYEAIDVEAEAHGRETRAFGRALRYYAGELNGMGLEADAEALVDQAIALGVGSCGTP